MASILDAAVRDGRITTNPARVAASGPRASFLPPVTTSTRRRFLNAPELMALAKASGQYEGLILTLGICGLRWGEVAALRVRDVDLLRKRLHVERSFSEVGGRLIEGDPKTHQIREVAIPTFLTAHLLVAIAGKQPDDLAFSAPQGGPIRLANFRSRTFNPALRAAEIPRLRIHDLRHTAAGLAVDAGANVKGVQRMLGHKDAAMTLNVYADLFDGHLDEVAERLDEVFAGANADSVRTENVIALRTGS